MYKNLLPSLLKKGMYWILDNRISILFLFGIIIITIKILNANITITSNSVNILLSVAAVTSTFLMFLAFKETKKSNTLKIGEVLYEKLKKRVDDIIEEGNGSILTPIKIKELAGLCKYPKEKLEEITFKDFMYPMTSLLRHIKKDPIYVNLIKKFGTNYIILLPDASINEAKKMSRIFEIIQSTFSIFLMHYGNVYYTCQLINNEKIPRKYKQILFGILLEDSSEYEEVYTHFTKGDKTSALIKDFDVLEFDPKNNNELKREDFRFDEFFIPLYKMNKIFTSIIPDI